MSGWLIFVLVVAVLATLAYLLGRWQRRSEERDVDRRKREAGKKAEDDAAAELSRLSGRGLYYVFNGLQDTAPGARGDIDHLVVGPAGIVVVETKGDPGVVSADFSAPAPRPGAAARSSTASSARSTATSCSRTKGPRKTGPG